GETAQLEFERDEHENGSRLAPTAVRGRVARLEGALAPFPDLLRLARGVLAGEGDVGDLGERHPEAPGSGLVVQLDVRRSAIVDVSDHLGTVVAPQRDVPAIIEGPIHQLA